MSVYQGNTQLPISINGTMIRSRTLKEPGIEKKLKKSSSPHGQRRRAPVAP